MAAKVLEGSLLRNLLVAEVKVLRLAAMEAGGLFKVIMKRRTGAANTNS